MTQPLQRRSAVLIAGIGMWILASVGVFLVIRFGNWFVFPSDDQWLNLGQVGGLYLAITGATLPAVVFVAFVVSRSTFEHREPVAALVTVTCGLIAFGVHVLRSPWSGIEGLEWWVPVGLDLAGIVVLGLAAIALTWLISRMDEARRRKHH